MTDEEIQDLWQALKSKRREMEVWYDNGDGVVGEYLDLTDRWFSWFADAYEEDDC